MRIGPVCAPMLGVEFFDAAPFIGDAALVIGIQIPAVESVTLVYVCCVEFKNAYRVAAAVDRLADSQEEKSGSFSGDMLESIAVHGIWT